LFLNAEVAAALKE